MYPAAFKVPTFRAKKGYHAVQLGKKWKHTHQQKALWIIFIVKFTSEDDKSNFLDFKDKYTPNKIYTKYNKYICKG